MTLPTINSPIGRIAILVLAIIAGGLAALQVIYYDRIFPNTYVGDIDVGGLRREVAEQKIAASLQSLNAPGVPIEYETEKGVVKETLPISVAADAKALATQAYSRGREGWWKRLSPLLALTGQSYRVEGAVSVPQDVIDNEIESLSQLLDSPPKDVRLHIVGTEVEILLDTRPGRVINKEGLRQQLQQRVTKLNLTPVKVDFITSETSIDPATATKAKAEAEKIMSGTLILVDRGERFTVSRSTIGSWIMSRAEAGALIADLDEEAISQYVSGLASRLNEPPTNLGVKVENGQVVDFIAPKAGRVVEETKTIAAVSEVLEKRRIGETTASEITLPVTVKEAVVVGDAANLGIKELIGRASTRLTGSPPNRIANIKNGVRLLSGHIIAPGEIYSTITALGTIDNTTGYLPELVIRGNRTVPEFGGGLCQVSTTLFRSVMNAGLPVVERQNHSYRVIYYEKDGDGNFIGPGLDATIYQPKPDFRFQNDTAGSILITGYVVGDMVTFELYGTKDGRSSVIDGPHTLTTTPAGAPIYIQTDELAPGEKKQIEKPHPGGTATATYTIRYADGQTKESVFKSYYRPWPAQFLVGADPTAPSEVGEGAETGEVAAEAAPAVN